MTVKIFRSILITSVTMLVTTFAIITFLMYGYFNGIHEKQLSDELNLISKAVEQSGIDYLEGLSGDNYRITLIDTNGDIMFDSIADSSKMENHLNREEVNEALLYGRGSSKRHSDTITENSMYEAVKLSDNKILRMSFTTASVLGIIFKMIQPMALIIIMAVIISAVMAKIMAKKITKPLNNLDLDFPLDNHTYEELSPLLNRINQQKRKLKHKGRELKQKTDEFNYIKQNMKEGLILLDSNKKILSINHGAELLIGTDSDCVGEDFIKVERRHDINMAIERAFGLGHGEVRVQKNDCEYQFDVSRIENEHKTVGAVMLAFDVTEQANAERIRREFSANVSHELKTPLQTITGSAELMENGLVKSEDIPRFVGHIRQEAQRLVSLVDDIIRLSQLDEGGQMPKEDICMISLVNEVFDVLSVSASKKNISLSVSGEKIIFNGVKRLLYEVIYNLCDNGIKYNKENGEVSVSITENTNEIICIVKDNGIGIPPEHQQRIFERFYRVDKSHSKKSGGTGLGLSIVKHAVLYHDGTISLESAVDKGTAVTLKFPKK